MTKKILILCTGNSCRSQMAEGLLRAIAPELEVYSAGTKPAAFVHPKAILVMREIGIDISNSSPKSIDQFLNDSFEAVITVCDNAKETCPVFLGSVKSLAHLGFVDPAEAQGTDEQVLDEFRRIRDQISTTFRTFYIEHLEK
ncbi:MAG: arsenate reductase ArsC [Ignavibacteria bacterium]|nr:arsenate reductase ArsC [Ignavibacteria bacterium]